MLHQHWSIQNVNVRVIHNFIAKNSKKKVMLHFAICQRHMLPFLV